MRSPDPVLSLRGVTGARGEAFRVTVPALDVRPGQAVAVVGESGSGKSTILDMLAGVLRPVSAECFTVASRGTVTDVAALWREDDHEGLRALRAAHLGYVLQTGGLAPFLTVAENVALPFWRDGVADGGRVAAMLERLGIAEHGAKYPRAVSVGQRQRVAIARALVSDPAIVLADEPTSALDADTADEAMALLTGVARAQGSALVVVTHDRPLAERHGLTIVTCARAGRGRSRLDLAEAA